MASDGNRRTRVMLCDDALGFPNLVALWLEGVEDVEFIGTTATATELLDVVADRAPDVLLLDLMLPEGPTSAELLARVRDLVPGVRVVLVSSLPSRQLETEAARLGADGFCPKATTVAELRAVVTGQG